MISVSVIIPACNAERYIGGQLDVGIIYVFR